MVGTWRDDAEGVALLQEVVRGSGQLYLYAATCTEVEMSVVELFLSTYTGYLY